jgi:serine/threonine-protein kinase
MLAGVAVPPTPPKQSPGASVETMSPHTFGPFVLDERIALGGTAEVYVAHPASGALPAPQLVVKRLLPGLRGDPELRSTFAEEASVHTRFRHPNIVTCFGVGEAAGEPYLTMEYVPGVDLHRVLRVLNGRGDAVPVGVACFIARQVLAALAEVHSAVGEDFTPLAIVHRDVSPSNVYLSEDGEVKLGDFGIARAASLKPRPGGGALRGKIGYLAPEQVAEAVVDHRADLFALANVLAEMVVGKPIFAGSGQLAILLAIRDVRLGVLQEARSRLPEPLVAVLERALARNPSDRYHDAEELAAALAPFALETAGGRREVKALVELAKRSHLEHPTVPPAGVPMRARAAAGAPSRPLTLVEPLEDESPSAPAPAPSLGVPTAPIDDQKTPIRAPIVADSFDDEWAEPALSQRTTAPFSPAPSHVKTSDGRLIGPLTYAKLVELVATGRVAEEDQVDFFGTGYVPVTDIEELARLLAPRSTVTCKIEGPGSAVWQAPAAEQFDPSIGGSIEPGAAAALAYVASRRATGVLLAQADDRRKEIYFVQGRLFHVPSNETNELLGEYLVARGMLERSDLDFALAVLPRFNGRIGEALMGLGLVDTMKMFRAIQEQGRDKVAELFAWSEGGLAFYEGAQPTKVEFPLDLPIGPIVETGISRMLDDRRASARWAPWVDRRLAVVDVAAGLRDAGWSPRVEQVLTLAKAPIVARTLLRSIAVSGATAHDAARAVEAARVAGLLRFCD